MYLHLNMKKNVQQCFQSQLMYQGIMQKAQQHVYRGVFYVLYCLHDVDHHG